VLTKYLKMKAVAKRSIRQELTLLAKGDVE